MPIYEYTCGTCQDSEEILFTIEGRVESVMCRCGGTKARKISAPGHVWAPTRTGQ